MHFTVLLPHFFGRPFLRRILIGLALLPLCLAVASTESGAQEAFQSGVAAFQKGDFKQAHAFFAEAMGADANNPRILAGFAVTAQKEGMIGLSLGLWRKAASIEPGSAISARAIQYLEGKLERKEIAHEVEFWESLREFTLTHFSLDRFLLVTLLLASASGWTVLNYAGRRRRAFLDESPLPPFPAIATFVSVTFVASLLLTIAKAYDQSVVRGTIVAKKIEARSSPEGGATALFDLYEGLEVIVRQTSGDWTQVTYPGGSTGWIPKTSVFTTADKAAP